MMHPTKLVMLFAIAASVAWAAAVSAGVMGTGPNSTLIPSTGQPLSIAITSPLDYSPMLMPPASMEVTGVCVVGEIPAGSFNVLYVIDVSGSTDASYMTGPAHSIAYVDANGNGLGSFAAPDPGDDFNGDGEAGETLDGEISGVLALNASLPEDPDVRVGIVAFASKASATDVDPATPNSGRVRQVFTAPPLTDRNVNSVPDIEEVLRSLRSEDAAGGSVELFTRVRRSALRNNTNFSAALATVNDTLAEFPADGRTVVFYLSDGRSNLGGRCFTGACEDELDTAVAAGTIIHTVGVGLASDPEDLEFVADRTGGTFVQVDDPGELSTVLPGLTPAGVDRVDVDGTTMPLDVLGTFSTVVECPVPGSFTITATCFADDVDVTQTAADLTLECQALIEICDDFIDNDGDGLIDCLDPDCPCAAIGKDPGVIRLRPRDPGHDYLAVHGSIPLCDGTALTTEPLGVLLTNANGVVYMVELPAGLLTQVGTFRYRYRNPAARREHWGVERLDVRYFARRGIYTFRFKAYGDLAPMATEAMMALQLKVGSEMFLNVSEWQRRSHGWRLMLPPRAAPPIGCMPLN